MEKLLTISIAAYNVENYIIECLEPFTKCKRINDIEIFIIIDGGTDGTLEKAKAFEKEYPNSIIIVEKENGGWGSTVNYGIEHASGKYFKQLDGDDYFLGENIDELIDYLDLINADIIISPFYTFDDRNGEIIEKAGNEKKDKYGKEFEIREVSEDIIMSMHAMAIKTQILKENNLRLIEKCFYTDIEYIIKVMRLVNSVAFFAKPIYMYRLSRDGQSCGMKGLIKHYKEHEFVTYTILKDYDLHKKDYSGYLDTIIKKRIEKLVGAQYGIFSMLEANPRHYRELTKYNNTLKSLYPYFYQHNTCARIMKLFRRINFKGYWLMMLYYKIKYKGR